MGGDSPTRMSSRSMASTLLAAFAQLFLSIRGQRTWIFNGTSKKTREHIVPTWYWSFPVLPLPDGDLRFTVTSGRQGTAIPPYRRRVTRHPRSRKFFFFFCLLQSTTGQLIFGAVLFSANVLINGSAGIWIADHGLFQYRRERDDSDFWTCWDATELSHTTIAFKPADIFAFAMLVVEVFTGQESFGSSMFDIDALLRIGNRKRPVDVQGFTNAIWDLVQRSWAQDPDERRLPTMWSRRGSG